VIGGANQGTQTGPNARQSAETQKTGAALHKRAHFGQVFQVLFGITYEQITLSCNANGSFLK
jgi:hypothetical protein